MHEASLINIHYKRRQMITVYELAYAFLIIVINDHNLNFAEDYINLWH